MLSKELHDLEINRFVTGTVNTTTPITVTYELAPFGHTLKSVIMELAEWGIAQRQRIQAGGLNSIRIVEKDYN